MFDVVERVFDGDAAASSIRWLVFLFLDAEMTGLAAITLLWRGTALDGVRALNLAAYKERIPLGHSVGIPFLLLGGDLTAA